jgi:hypothetical protein
VTAAARPPRPPRLPRRRDESGLALSTPVALLSAAGVLLAGAAFLLTGPGDEQPADRGTLVAETPAAVEQRTVLRAEKPERPAVDRGSTYVDVYNNSGVNGLAAATSAQISGAGWQVVTSDNWYGTIPASTVYYPPALAAEARLLGRDLGIARIMPAVDPMSMDRLTVILTADRA